MQCRLIDSDDEYSDKDMIDIDFIAYSIIDEKLALDMCKRLDIISLALFSSRSVREYDERLISH